MPEVSAIAKNVGASTKRLRPIIELVRGSKVTDALDTLSLMSSPWAHVVAKVVKSAAANAENNLLMDQESLVIVKVAADQARSLKRFRPRARGRIGRVTKRSSHITVVVDAEEVT